MVVSYFIFINCWLVVRVLRALCAVERKRSALLYGFVAATVVLRPIQVILKTVSALVWKNFFLSSAAITMLSIAITSST